MMYCCKCGKRKPRKDWSQPYCRKCDAGEAIRRELIVQLVALCGDMVQVLENLGKTQFARIDSRAWHRVLTKRFRRLTSGLSFSEKPNMKKGRTK